MRRSKKAGRLKADNVGRSSQPQQTENPVERHPKPVKLNSTDPHAATSLSSQPRVHTGASSAIMTRSRLAGRKEGNVSKSLLTKGRDDTLISGHDQPPTCHQLSRQVQATSTEPHASADAPVRSSQVSLGFEQATKQVTSKSSSNQLENLAPVWQTQESLGERQSNSRQLHSVVSHADDSHPLQPCASSEFVPDIVARSRQERRTIFSQLLQSRQTRDETQVSARCEQSSLNYQEPSQVQERIENGVDHNPSQKYSSEDNTTGDSLHSSSEECPTEEQSSSGGSTHQDSQHEDQLNSLEHHEVNSHNSNPQATEIDRQMNNVIENLNNQQQPQQRGNQARNIGEGRSQYKQRSQSGLNTESLHAVSPNPSHPADSADSADQRRRARGHTKLNDIWCATKRLKVDFNRKGQPVGRNARKLSSFLGTIARNGHMIPLAHHGWRKVSETTKKSAWQLVVSKFVLDNSNKRWVMNSMSDKWRNWKSLLKTRYLARESDDWINRDDRIIEQQLQDLVKYWNTEEGKRLSLANKVNCSKMKTRHTAGSRSFAQICDMEREKMPNREEPSRAKIYIMTHTRKDGRPVDATSATVISQLNEVMAQQPEDVVDPAVQDEILDQILGPDKQKNNSGSCSKRDKNLEEELKRALDAKKAADEEIHEMREKILEMEEEQQIMKEEQQIMKENQQRMEQKYAALQSQVDMMVGAMLRNNANLNLNEILATSQVGLRSFSSTHVSPRYSEQVHVPPPVTSNNQLDYIRRRRHEEKRRRRG